MTGKKGIKNFLIGIAAAGMVIISSLSVLAESFQEKNEILQNSTQDEAQKDAEKTAQSYLIDSWSGAEQIADLKGASSPDGSVLTWSAIPDAEGYIIGGIQNGQPYRQLGFVTGGNTTTYTDHDASLTDFSYYWVFPYKKENGKVVRGKASSGYVYGIKQLPAPQNLTAASVPGGVNLSWSGVSGADGFIIKRRIGSSGSADRIADITGTSYSDMSASETDTCFYWVYAYKMNGSGKRAGVISSYTYAKAGYKEKLLSVTPTELTIEDQARVAVTWKGSGYIYCRTRNSSIVTCKWEDGWKDKTFGLIITALKPGETTVEIYNEGETEKVILNIKSTKTGS